MNSENKKRAGGAAREREKNKKNFFQTPARIVKKLIHFLIQHIMKNKIPLKLKN